MILYEFEGKEILAKNGILIPKSQLISDQKEKIKIETPFYLKAQVLSGKRKVAGGIVLVEDQNLTESELKKALSMIVNEEKVTNVLVEEKADYKTEYYISISYDGGLRSPIISFSESGGTGIEERIVKIIPINIISKNFDKKDLPKSIVDILPKLINIFLDEDMLLLEINPLVEDKNKNLIALDAKIKLDDEAGSRHIERNFPERGVAGHLPTKNEVMAKQIDDGDYHGTAGSTYFDLDGDIGILASGGGASLSGMDMLISLGGKPANYTEYSSDPSREKVKKLTKIVLSNKHLKGLWVGGAVANFTDIYETLSGVLDGIKESNINPQLPIVVRRGGPRETEAFEMLKKEKGFNFHVFGSETSITESAKIMVDLVKKYASTT